MRRGLFNAEKSENKTVETIMNEIRGKNEREREMVHN